MDSLKYALPLYALRAATPETALLPPWIPYAVRPGFKHCIVFFVCFVAGYDSTAENEMETFVDAIENSETLAGDAEFV
jgi:hypothetical protein